MMPPDQVTFSQPQAVAPAPHGNWFDSLAPTLGAIGGGILGGIGGTFVGGPVGTIAGGIAGAGLGGAAGQQFENSQTGSKTSTLGTGLESAAGQAVGEAIPGVGGLALKALGGSDMLGGASDLATRTLLKDQLNSRVLPHGINPDSVISTLMENGVTDLSKAPKTFSLLTGAPDASGANAGLYNNTVDSIINQMKENGTKIFGSYSGDTAEQATSGSLGANFTNQSAKNAAQKYITGQLQDAGLIEDAAGGMKGLKPVYIASADGAEPDAVVQAYKNLRDAVRQQPFEGNGKATAQAYGAVADQLAQDLFEHPEATLTPEIKDDMLAALNPLQKSNPTAYNTQRQVIENATTARDLQNAQQKLVEASQAVSAPASKAAHIGAADLVRPGIGFAVGGIPGGIAGTATDIAMRNPTVLAKLTGAAANAPDLVSGAGSILSNPAVVAGGGALGAGGAGLAASPPGGGTNNNQLNAGGGTSMQNGQGAGMTLNANTPASTLDELNRMLEADPLLASSLAPQVTQMTQKVAAATAAKQALQQYLQTLQAAGGPQGPVGGLLEQISGAITGGPAAQVGAQQKALQALLQQAGATGVTVPGLQSNAGGLGTSVGQAQGVLGALGAQ